MDDEGYNGWTNKPTWLVKLWIDNSFEDAREFAEVYRDRDSEALNEYVVEMMIPDLPESGLASDLMGYVLACVNWGEIGEALIDDWLEDDDEEDEDDDEYSDFDGDTMEDQDNWERRDVLEEQKENQDFAHDDDFSNLSAEDTL